MFHIFVYGTLLSDSLVLVRRITTDLIDDFLRFKGLIKRVPVREDAILHNFQRFAIKGAYYPGIIPSPGKFVKVIWKKFSTN